MPFNIFSLLKKVINVGKKIFFVVLVYFVVIIIFSYFISKDKPKIAYDPVQMNRNEIYKLINDKDLNSTKEGKLSIALYRGITCGFIGEACTNNPKDGDQNSNRSLLGFMSNLITLPYVNTPASGIYWAYSGLQNAGFVPKTYAAEGIGFAAIKPFIKIWTVFRDLSFIILVLILISIGFMVMFRMKINPQTVISVESALPKIVITLLLITFSYAIAGFLIDIMYIIILIVISTLSTVNIDPYTPSNVFNLINDYAAAGPGKLFPAQGSFNLINTGNYLLSTLPSAIRIPLKVIGGYLAAFGLAQWIYKDMHIEDPISSLKDIGIQAATFGINIGALPNIVQFLIYFVTVFILMPFALPFVISLLVGLTIIFLFFRIFFLLITTYIQILLLIFFAPIILLFEAIPGKSPFAWWFKNLFANLLTFPFVVLIILVSDIIIKINAQVGVNQFWAPPFIGPANQQAMIILIGLGMYLMIPDLIKMMKELLGAKGMPFNFGLGTFFGGATAAWGGVQGGVGLFTSLTQMPGLGIWLQKQASKEGSFMSRFIAPTMQTSLERAMGEFMERKKS